MEFALRLLVFALVLASSGIVQPLACASASATEACCEDCESKQHECSDCLADCGLCIACPLTAAPSFPSVEPVAGIVIAGPVAPRLSGRPASAHSSDIFQPPRA